MPERMRAFVVGNYMNANFLQVDRLPSVGESLAARAVFQEHGGKGLNLAVGLHRLGVQVDLLMAVGDDAAGRAVMAALQAEGLHLRHVQVLKEASGYGVGFIDAHGHNFLAAYQGANALLGATHVQQAEAALAKAQWVLAQFEVADEPILAAFTRARAQGATTYLNPSPWRTLSADLLALTDVLVVNAPEAAQMLGCAETLLPNREDWVRELPALARQWGWTGELLVVTLGAQGSVALERSGKVNQAAAFAVVERDATGAGDAFGAGLVWSLMGGLPLSQALRLANACGALVATQSGILAHLPTTAQMLARAEMDRAAL